MTPAFSYDFLYRLNPEKTYMPPLIELVGPYCLHKSCFFMQSILALEAAIIATPEPGKLIFEVDPKMKGIFSLPLLRQAARIFLSLSGSAVRS